jgi:hypothetical protein
MKAQRAKKAFIAKPLDFRRRFWRYGGQAMA